MNSSHSFITRLFPPPKFLEMPAVGFDISDEVVRFTELKRVGAHFELGIFGEKKIPADIIDEGYIKDKPALTQILKEVQKEHGFKFVKASLPEEKSYLFRTSIPHMDEADIRSALQFKIEENVPVSLSSAVFDYKIIRASSEANQNIDVGVSVVHQKVVNSYLTVLKDAGFIPLELRTEALAIGHAVLPKTNHGTHIIIGLREAKTVLGILSDNVVQFTSTLSVGGRAIAESLNKEFGVPEKAEEKVETKASSEMFNSLVNAVSLLRDEIQKLFVYWDDHPEVSRGKNIEDIVIAGSAALSGLDKYLAQSTKVPVLIADAWKNIASLEEYVPPITLRQSLDYIPALGLALPYD